MFSTSKHDLMLWHSPAMTATWGVLMILGLLCNTESKCSPTTFYKNCWIRRFPGIFIDLVESQRKGAQLLKFYQEDTAMNCSKACCLTRNVSCNLAVFHYETTENSVNCFHFNCPTLESCILRRRSNVILYNITKGIDPDLLVFGKYFTSSLRLWPNLSTSRSNTSEPSSLDKRQFHRPPLSSFPSQTSPDMKVLTSPQHADWGMRKTTQTTSIFVSTPQASVHSTVNTLAVEAVMGNTTLQPILNTSPAGNLTAVSAATKPYSNIVVPVNFDSSKQYPNDTKGYVMRNHTSEEAPGHLRPVWELATGALLAPVIICSSILLACCCTILFAVGWRSRKRGHYKTTWRIKRGSMRLIKYVIVRESL
ncbi:MANS4 protein, partial [Atractosteus spatula]|nr:MANS4 protein [Atractosteus spatula]